MNVRYLSGLIFLLLGFFLLPESLISLPDWFQRASYSASTGGPFDAYPGIWFVAGRLVAGMIVAFVASFLLSGGSKGEKKGADRTDEPAPEESKVL